MNPRQFADKHLHPYKIQGEEISPKHCPYCGSNTKDTYTFFLNLTKETFICHRGSCGKQGHFTQLLRDFGEDTRMERIGYEIKSTPKLFKKPTATLKPITPEIIAYMGKRLISKETLSAFKVQADSKGNIAFPYYDSSNNLVFIKYRPARPVQDGERKSWREKDTQPILWGMNLCQYDKPLIITEGEPDALALYEAGIRNVTSVPSGCKDFDWVDNCWIWLENFKSIILIGDTDEAGQEMVEALTTKLGEYRVSVATVAPYKDANELLYKVAKKQSLEDAKAELQKRISQAEPVEVKGIINLSQVKKLDYSKLVKVKSSIQALNSHLDGYFMGQTTVWTGINSSGKSTFLGQELIYSIEQGFNVCAYSGELPANLFKYWIDLQIAGEEGISHTWSATKLKNVAIVKESALKEIEAWYDNKFFLFDTSSGLTNSDDLFKVFEYAAKRYNCKVFLIDNLMTVEHEGSDKDFYRSQSKFVGEVIAFSKRMDVHVHLVAHPRKTSGKLTKMDVMGSGDITNRADNVLSIHRIPQEEKYTTVKGVEQPTEYAEFDNMLQLFKNRFAGTQDIEIGLTYDRDSKRMYKAEEGKLTLSWNKDQQEEPPPPWVQQAISQSNDLPF